MKRLALPLTAAALLATSIAAQTRPDFSGRWTSEPKPTVTAQRGGGGAARGAQRGTRRGAGGQRATGRRGGGARGRQGDMGSGWGSNLTVTQDANLLTVQYAFFVRGDLQPPLKFVYALDGSGTMNSVMMGRGIQMQPSTAEWDADKLVITTVHTFVHPETGWTIACNVKQTLSLESPTSMVVEATRSGVLGGPPSTTRTVYRKY